FGIICAGHGRRRAPAGHLQAGCKRRRLEPGAGGNPGATTPTAGSGCPATPAAGPELRIMISGGFRAMGTVVEVRTGREGDIEAARGLFERIEQVCSRFRDDSELSQINSWPGPAVGLSPTMAQVVASAAEARRRTGGLVDIGVGKTVLDWGYDRSFVNVKDLDLPPATPDSPTWELNERLLHRSPGIRLDLGGIAKGWACDQTVEAGLARMAGAGGDIRSADPATVVEIIDPWSRPAVTINLGVGALATSSVTRRRWQVGGRPAHHLIDPRTLQPSSSPVVSASAVASTAVEAEAAAKAVLLLGADGLVWADDQDWIRSAVAVWNDGGVYATTELEVAG
ncbi:MAG: FAD:protein FMN transferase, partial [Acidimicrobiia bacterium]